MTAHFDRLTHSKCLSKRLDLEELGRHFTNISDPNTSEVESSASLVNEILEKSSSEIKPKPPRKGGWWSPDLKALRTNALGFLSMAKEIGDTYSYRMYSIARNAFHKQCRQAKLIWIKEKTEKLIEVAIAEGIGTLYKPAKKSPSNLSCAVTLNEFYTSCTKLFSHFPKPTLHRLSSCQTELHELTQPFTEDEVSNTLKGLKSKAPSKDGFSPFQLKLAAPHITSYITKLFNAILRTSYFPSQWLESCLFFIYKKGDQKDRSA